MECYKFGKVNSVCNFLMQNVFLVYIYTSKPPPPQKNVMIYIMMHEENCHSFYYYCCLYVLLCVEWQRSTYEDC